MIIAITGANGFIGKQLTVFFQSAGYDVRRIQRIHEGIPAFELAGELKGTDVVINLAGAPIIGRWTRAYKETLFDSRIITTRKLVEALSLLGKKPGLFISASAVGIYASEGEQTESNFSKAGDYLAEICSEWELEAKKAMPFTRVAITRFGIVLGKNGGALARMLPLFRIGLGGKIASGRQGFSWIHDYDLVRAVQFIIDHPHMSGDFNFTAPGLVDNSQFTRVLAKVLKRPAFFAVPSLALKIVFGEGAIALTGGQFARPEHLLQEGFQFRFPGLEEALRDIVGG